LRGKTFGRDAEAERPGTDIGKKELSIFVRENFCARGLTLPQQSHRGSGDAGTGLIDNRADDVAGLLRVGLLAEREDFGGS
jgi:hypothetical protein